MNNSNPITRFAARYTQLVSIDAEITVKMIPDTMTHGLVADRFIEIHGFGSFDLKHRPARV